MKKSLIFIGLFAFITARLIMADSVSTLVNWQLVETAKSNMIKVTNNSNHNQTLLINVAPESEDIFIVGCRDLANPILSAGASAICTFAPSQTVSWYFAKTPNNHHHQNAYGTYQLEMAND